VNSSVELALVPLAILAVAVVLVALAGRGKRLKCPNCGTVFKAPAMDDKISGLGWTLPYTGRLKCPKCGEIRGRRDYQKAPPGAPT